MVCDEGFRCLWCSQMLQGRDQDDRGRSSRMIGGPSGRKQAGTLGRAQTTDIQEEKMSHSERMSAVDTTWLRMERPANPMMIVGVWILEGPVAVDKVEKQIAEGHVSYRRYRQKVEYAPAGVYWRDDPNFDLARHMKRVKLPGRGGKPELER